MIVEHLRIARITVGVDRWQGSFWWVGESQAFETNWPSFCLNGPTCRVDPATDELVIEFEVPSVWPIKGSANPTVPRIEYEPGFYD